MIRFLLICMLLIPFAGNAKVFNVGIISSENSAAFSALLSDEISSLMGEVEVRVYPYKAGTDSKIIDNALEMAERSSDALVFVGYVSSGRGQAKSLTKPTLSVMAFDRGDFTRLIAEDIDYAEEFSVFKKLFKADSLKVLYSDYVFCSSGSCSSEMGRILSVIDIPHEKIAVSDGNDLSKLNKGDVALVLRQPQLSNEKYKDMLDRLADKGVKTFSFGNYSDAETGVMAVNSVDKDLVKIARTAALEVASVASGNLDKKVIKVDRSRGIVLNMAQAKRAGFFPSWDYMRKGELINFEEAEKPERFIGFKDALEMAIRKNEDVATKQVELESAKEMLNMAKSAFRPTLNLSAGALLIDDDRAKVARGTSPEKSLNVALQLQQIIYSDEVFALRDKAVFNERAKKYLSEQAKLDIVETTSSAYLNVLRARTYLKITRDNLETTKANYNLAKARDIAGAANPAELHRWSAKIAMAMRDRNDAENSVKLAMTEFARVVGEDIDGEFDLEELDIFTKYTLFHLIKDRISFIDNDKSFKMFKNAMTDAAVKNSVELMAIDQLISSSKRSVTFAKRRYTRPTIALGGEYKRVLERDGEGSTPPDWYDDNEWSVGLKLNFPIYEGGKRSAELNIEKANLRKSGYEKSRVKKLIKQRMIASIENAKSAYSGYLLAKDAADAATKTFKIMSDLYSKGAVSVTELIDTQNAMLNANVNIAASKYGFLEKMIGVERAYGGFSVFSESDNPEFIKILDEIVE